ncbi:BatD family protein [soil metagenome]
MHKYINTIVLMLLLACTASAQSPSFRAVVQRNPVSENESFQLTFIIENMEAKSFSPPVFDGFNVIAGPSQSESIQIINGKQSRSLQVIYLLQAQAPGKFTIPPASIVSGGKTVKSNSITISVNKASEKKGGNGTISVGDYLNENLFLVLSLDKNEVYKGEQVTATYKLYRKVQVEQYAINNAPSFNGFWTVDIQEPGKIDYNVETYNGVQYDVAVIKKVALFPQRTGDLEIDAMSLECVVLIPQGWSARRIPHKFSSKVAKVKVKPLPEAGMPKDFNGLVGDLNMQVTMDKTQARTDDPVTLSIKFSGKGNIRFLESPKPELPKDFEVFDPKISEKSTRQGNVVGGSRQIDYLLIPRRAGSYKVPEFSVSYFDLSKNDYVTLRSPEIVISVEGESTTSSPITTGINKEEVELLGQDIRYIATSTPILQKNGGFFISIPAFAGIYAMPFVLFAGLLVFRKKRSEMLGNTKLMKHRAAGKVASKRLKQAQARMKADDSRGFYDELLKATWGYLGDKLGIPPANLNKDIAANALRNKGIDEDTIKQLITLLDVSEMALYAPSSIRESLQQTYDRATGIIEQLESTLA